MYTLILITLTTLVVEGRIASLVKNNTHAVTDCKCKLFGVDHFFVHYYYNGRYQKSDTCPVCMECKAPVFSGAKYAHHKGGPAFNLLSFSSGKSCFATELRRAKVHLAGSCKMTYDRETGAVKLEASETVGYWLKTDSKPLMGTIAKGDSKIISLIVKECGKYPVTCGSYSAELHLCPKPLENCKEEMWFAGRYSGKICYHLPAIIGIMAAILVLIALTLIDKIQYGSFMLFPIYLLFGAIYYLVRRIWPEFAKCAYCGGFRHWTGSCDLTCLCGFSASNSEILKTHRARCERNVCQSVVQSSARMSLSPLYRLVIVVLILTLVGMVVPGAHTQEWNNETIIENGTHIGHTVIQYASGRIIEIIKHMDIDAGKMPFPNKYITSSDIVVRGSSTSESANIDSVVINLKAVTGEGMRYRIPIGSTGDFLNLDVYIASATTVSKYEYQYTTGESSGIQVNALEMCTGTDGCISHLKEWQAKGWAGAMQAGTETWGCEQFGCAGINTGCSAVACADIMSARQTDVWKYMSTKHMTVLCIRVGNTAGCQSINFDTGVKRDGLTVLGTVDGGIDRQIPEMLAVTDNVAYTGPINTRGEFTKRCGMLQHYNKIIHGVPDVQWRYECNGIADKTYVVTRCFRSGTCDGLTPMGPAVTFNHTSRELVMDHKVVGTLMVELDVELQLKKVDQDAVVSIKQIECTGCHTCDKGIVCKLLVESDSDGYVSLSCSGVELRDTIIVLETGTRSYFVQAESMEETPEIHCIASGVKGKISEVKTIGKFEEDKDKYDSLNHGDYKSEGIAKSACETMLCEWWGDIHSWGKTAMIWMVSIMVVMAVVALLMYCWKSRKGSVSSAWKTYNDRKNKKIYTGKPGGVEI